MHHYGLMMVPPLVMIYMPIVLRRPVEPSVVVVAVAVCPARSCQSGRRHSCNDHNCSKGHS
ncbi:MAG: hypothetical protein ABRQ33_07895 [Smithellaceae bacterium]